MFTRAGAVGWQVPALMAVKDPGTELSCGLVFSCFMLCISIGANLFAVCVARKVSATASTSAALAVAVAAMSIPLVVPYPPSLYTVLAAFCVFETAVGALMPAMGVLRASIIPQGVQSTVMTAYRLPLNTLVVLGTRKRSPSHSHTDAPLVWAYTAPARLCMPTARVVHRARARATSHAERCRRAHARVRVLSRTGLAVRLDGCLCTQQRPLPPRTRSDLGHPTHARCIGDRRRAIGAQACDAQAVSSTSCSASDIALAPQPHTVQAGVQAGVRQGVRQGAPRAHQQPESDTPQGQPEGKGLAVEAQGGLSWVLSWRS